jgi:hypothetical protein
MEERNNDTLKQSGLPHFIPRTLDHIYPRAELSLEINKPLEIL